MTDETSPFEFNVISAFVVYETSSWLATLQEILVTSNIVLEHTSVLPSIAMFEHEYTLFYVGVPVHSVTVCELCRVRSKVRPIKLLSEVVSQVQQMNVVNNYD